MCVNKTCGGAARLGSDCDHQHFRCLRYGAHCSLESFMLVLAMERAIGVP